MFDRPVVVVWGGGDLGSACALRLLRCGFRVIVAEREQPLAVRRTVSFSEAVYEGRSRVEEAEGVLVGDQRTIDSMWRRQALPIVVDPELESVRGLRPELLVDARMSKRLGSRPKDVARRTVALGPGPWAGRDVHAVVETNRGPDLGRVIWAGQAAANTSIPAPVEGHAADRVLRARSAGTLYGMREIGDVVDEGDVIAEVSGSPVVAPFRGLVRGLLRDGMVVEQGRKLGDLDPRLDLSLCFRVSDKGLAVAGGVLEAAIMLLNHD